MKHYMQPKSSVLREAQATTDQTSFNSPNPSSSSSKAKSTSSRKQRFAKENAPPLDLNAMPSPSPSKTKPPRPPPPPSNSLKRKLNLESLMENSVSGCADSGVKVIVRMRPPKDEEDEELIVQKTSPDSLTINGHAFTFDSVAEIQSTQLDIFQLVGAPLVENCLAGFNSSVFAYGQTGSGKTYTIWGPANALLEENLSSDQQGLTPRVFEQLFARINEEQIKHAAEQLTYQCRCSFLEIYNEQITDLLDPSQRNLQIREDVNSGVYVEDLTEERVFTMKDVTRLLIKGLSNRRTGATSINAESSRSHSVFTCVVDSHCKSTSDGFSTFKTSRINLVDLAGSERQKLTGAAGDRLKEAGNINRSLSQLGNLINILAEVSQTGKQRHIPYRDSRLTFLLQESLGGNAKLAMICAISPVQSCKSETFSTLRFAQRAKAIKNKAVVNEEMHDDVNSLREVIRQLKDELLFLKANGNKLNDSFAGGFARRSLNLLKLSFNRPMTLPRVKDDSDVEMEIDEESVEKVNFPVGMHPAGSEENNTDEMKKVEVNLSSVDSQSKTNEVGYIPQVSEDMDINVKEGISEHIEEGDTVIVDCAKPVRNDPDVTSINALNSNIAEEISNTLNGDLSGQHADKTETVSSSLGKSLDEKSSNEMVSSCPVSEHVGEVSEDISVSIAPFDSSRGSMKCIKSPAPSVSPRVSASRKSLRTSSMSSASQKDLKDDIISETEAVHRSSMKSSMHRSSNTLPTQRIRTAENLAASLHRGLEIIDSHSQSSALRRSLFGLSFNPSETKRILPVQKVDAGVQTSPEDTEIPEEGTDVVMCSNCQSKAQLEVRKSNESLNLQLVLPAEESESTEKAKKLVPKAVEKVLAGSFRREMALEEFCARQNYEITQLKRLVQQYKHERECNAIITQTREDKILRLESVVDGVLPTEEFMEEELAALTNEHKLLKDRYENHPEVLRTRIELKRVQDELDGYRNFFDMGEREVLLEEIHDLRSQLQLYIDSSSVPTRKQSSIMRLTLTDPNLAQPLGTIPESGAVSAEEKLEQERVHWLEAESNWISLAEELRLELDGTRSMAEKQKQELDTEKRCAEELKEAMQLAMEGQVRMLEQYADLEEKHMNLLARHRKIRDGADDVKKAAAKAGVRGAESKFINALAAGISTLRAEKEKERRYLRDENKALQAQLRDTAEAVQAAGELLMRLKEAEEAVASAQNRAMEAERETDKAYKEMESLKKKQERDISTLNQLLAESRLPAEAIRPTHDLPRYDTVELESFNAEDAELLKLPERSSWFSGYDQCNI